MPRAEREGFEPSVATRTTTVFETVPINRSGTSPVGDYIIASGLTCQNVTGLRVMPAGAPRPARPRPDMHFRKKERPEVPIPA